jgi:transglutaminase-like putative cysteine protease
LRLRILLFALLLPAVAHAREFDVRPAPSWVERLDVDTAARVPREQARWGIYSLLSDHQVRVTASGTTEYFRRVRQVVSSSGVQNASELTFDFDPSYQRLVLHEIAVVRGGKRIDDLDAGAIRVIEKESDADDRIYDGMLSALAFLSDVRPGDTIDVSWSLAGANPILGGRYADSYELTSAIPSKRIRHRLLYPAARMLRFRSTLAGVEPASRVSGKERELVWELRDVEALDVEDDIPDWFDPWQHVDVTEFASWNDVARWAAAMFRSDEASRNAVRTLANTIRSEHAGREAQIVAAIRFVQDEVRYLGFEMGRNSHEPHAPAEVLEQRWGDCKDKSFLLAELLRELGLDAAPALVNTRLRHSLDAVLPNPFAFDHVITRVQYGGKTLWIDATISDQGGSLETIDTPNDERALVVSAGTTGLARVETKETAATEIVQTYTTRQWDEPTTLVVRSTYRGGDADAIRSSLASMSANDLARERINRFAVDQPKITADAPPHVSDDRDRDVLTIVERYTIRDAWKDGSWSYYPRAIENHLRRPDTLIRSMPLAFDYPLSIEQRVTFHLPEHFSIRTGTETIESAAFRYESEVDSSGNTVTLRHSLHSRRDAVDVRDVPEHLTRINEIWDRVGYTLTRNNGGSATREIRASALGGWSLARRGAGYAGVAQILLVCITVAAVRLRRDPSRAEAFQEAVATAFRPGEAPASSISVRDRGEMERRLARMACGCGAHLFGSGEWSRARYDERELVIVTRHCKRCGREQSIYFREPGLIALG